MTIERGTPVEVTTAAGNLVRMIALGPRSQGRDFPVVWVCTEAEMTDAQREGREPHGLPWPADALRVLEHS